MTRRDDQEPNGNREFFRKNAVIALTILCGTAVVIVELLNQQQDWIFHTFLTFSVLLIIENQVLE